MVNFVGSVLSSFAPVLSALFGVTVAIRLTTLVARLWRSLDVPRLEPPPLFTSSDNSLPLYRPSWGRPMRYRPSLVAHSRKAVRRG